jgi:hypothetical protein
MTGNNNTAKKFNENVETPYPHCKVPSFEIQIMGFSHSHRPSPLLHIETWDGRKIMSVKPKPLSVLKSEIK